MCNVTYIFHLVYTGVCNATYIFDLMRIYVCNVTRIFEFNRSYLSPCLVLSECKGAYPHCVEYVPLIRYSSSGHYFGAVQERPICQEQLKTVKYTPESV